MRLLGRLAHYYLLVVFAAFLFSLQIATHCITIVLYVVIQLDLLNTALLEIIKNN
jgi:diacylglycerol kinase